MLRRHKPDGYVEIYDLQPCIMRSIFFVLLSSRRLDPDGAGHISQPSRNSIQVRETHCLFVAKTKLYQKPHLKLFIPSKPLKTTTANHTSHATEQHGFKKNRDYGSRKNSRPWTCARIPARSAGMKLITHHFAVENIVNSSHRAAGSCRYVRSVSGASWEPPPKSRPR